MVGHFSLVLICKPGSCCHKELPGEKRKARGRSATNFPTVGIVSLFSLYQRAHLSLKFNFSPFRNN